MAGGPEIFLRFAREFTKTQIVLEEGGGHKIYQTLIFCPPPQEKSCFRAHTHTYMLLWWRVLSDEMKR